MTLSVCLSVCLSRPFKLLLFVSRWNVGPTLVAMATTFGLGAEIQSPCTGLCIMYVSLYCVDGGTVMPAAATDNDNAHRDDAAN